MKKFSFIFLLAAFSLQVYILPAQPRQNYSLNILVIGAHPDDADRIGGTAYKWIQQGHNVILVSTTNGNAGHHLLGKEELASIRLEEARRAGEVIGAKYIVMDINDGELVPSLENRLKIIRLIREHKADVVITHRPYDYHPDHRYTGALVLDAAYMVTVPLVLPEVPFLKKNPVFLYMSDHFTDPLPFKPDVCIDVDGEAIEKSIDMFHEHTSQVYEWLPYNKQTLHEVPTDEKERKADLANWVINRRSLNEFSRNKLIEQYGKKRGINIKCADCFQDSGYGTKLTKSNINYYFPFFD